MINKLINTCDCLQSEVSFSLDEDQNRCRHLKSLTLLNEQNEVFTFWFTMIWFIITLISVYYYYDLVYYYYDLCLTVGF